MSQHLARKIPCRSFKLWRESLQWDLFSTSRKTQATDLNLLNKERPWRTRLITFKSREKWTSIHFQGRDCFHWLISELFPEVKKKNLSSTDCFENYNPLILENSLWTLRPLGHSQPGISLFRVGHRGFSSITKALSSPPSFSAGEEEGKSILEKCPRKEKADRFPEGVSIPLGQYVVTSY